jgi:uncharacterized membrane protein (DUF373 family)
MKIPHRIRKLLIAIDDIVHILVATFLVIAAFIFIVEAASKLAEPNIASALQIISDLLFVLVIMELLWTVIRYLKRLPFSLRPFIFVGIISSIRGMVIVEAKLATGFSEMKDTEFYRQLAEIGVSAGVVFILILSLYLLSKMPPASSDE